MSLFRIPAPILLATLTVVSGLSAPQSARAAQGEGELAQAPLVNNVQIPPNFIMAVDNSGSMTFETLFPARDGYGCWNTDGNHRFFNNDNTLRTSGNCNFHHLFPYEGYRIDTARYAVPPIDLYGFARSHVYNPQYYNPEQVYGPWIDQNLNGYPAPSPTATRPDPRVNDNHFNFTVDRLDDIAAEGEDTGVDTTYQNNATYPAGTVFPAGIQVRRNGACGGLPNTGSGYQTLATQIVTTASCNNVGIRRPTINTPSTVELFRVPRGTVLPEGMAYFHPNDSAACGVVATNRPSQRQWTVLTSDVTTTSTCEIGIRYFPATFYLPTSAPLPDDYRAANRVLAEDACGGGCDMYRYEIKPANYTNVTAYNQAIQNFANWFSFYGNRNRAMVAGLTRSLSSVNNMYVGYFRINNLTPVTMRNMAVAGDKTALFTEMLALNASGSTPNRSAVDYIGTQFRRTGAGAPIRLACQKNAGMLFTDGYSNQGGPTPTPANADGSMGSPLADQHSSTLADIAAEHYLTNLRPDLEVGKVPIPSPCNASDPRMDCNPNLHMNFYGITLGAKGYIFGVDMDATNDPYANPPAWGPREDDRPSTVDEIWHATLNARGRYVNAQSPVDITNAMREILSAVEDDASPTGSVAISGARISTNSLIVQPSYGVASQGTDWYGDISAQRLTVDDDGLLEFQEIWTAASRLPVAASRRIYFAQGSTNVVPTVREFTSANVGSTAALCSGELAFCAGADITSITGLNVTLAQAINYLRGDRTLESGAGAKLRTRTSPLGDIVNSTPVISSPTDDYGYRTLRGATIGAVDPYGYAAYLSAKSTRELMVYVGANDGMLHGFRGTDGVERFAVIPSTSLAHMGNLLYPYDAALSNDQRFSHRYYVDGPVTVSDARFGTSWRTVLAATGGAGGKGVFALDVSNPGSFATSNYLWELTPTVTTHGPHVGNMLGKPMIAPVRTGTAAPVWKVFVGNGYDSANGQASLFVVDAATGTTTRIPAVEVGGPATPNGLGNIALVDQYIAASTVGGRDGYVDTAYAGDLHGNLWKFDLRNNTVANGGVPVFRAVVGGVRQPITGALSVSYGPGGGLMVYFGTGSYSFEDDPTDRSLQSFYAFLDRGGSGTKTPADLVAQQLTSYDHDGNAATAPLRRLTNNAINYVTKFGWYMDLAVVTAGVPVLAGERFVGAPRLQSGEIMFVTFEPAGGAAADPCDATGTNWLYSLNSVSASGGLSGLSFGAPDAPGTPVGTAGTVYNSDVGLPITFLPIAVMPTGAADDDDPATNDRCKLALAGTTTGYMDRKCGRQSWRQIR